MLFKNFKLKYLTDEYYMNFIFVTFSKASFPNTQSSLILFVRYAFINP